MGWYYPSKTCITKCSSYSTLISYSFVAFNHVRIPRENLLNKGSDVLPDGKYISSFKDPKKRFGAALGALSSGRVGITSMAVTNLRSCLPIAIRYILYCYRSLRKIPKSFSLS